MNYYEELGLQSSASEDEIRGGYRALVRVLHPDAQPDDASRRVAEAQLKRLNGIAEVLLNRSRRLRYDLTLDTTPSHACPEVIVLPPPPLTSRLARFSSLLLLCAGAIIGCGGVFVVQEIASDMTPPATVFTSKTGDPQASAVTASESAASQAASTSAPARATTLPAVAAMRLRNSVAAKKAALPKIELEPQPTSLVASSAVPQTSAPPATPPPPPLSTAVDLQPRAPTAVAPDADPCPLCGQWVYTPQINAPSPRLYAPEYIQLTSKIAGEFLTGSFRSRYYVTNQPLSPNVDFEFIGRQFTPQHISADWVSADGSRGTMIIRLLNRGQISVDWVRTMAGSGRTLAYGKAVLLKESDTADARP